ncbi:MAG: TolC family protein [Burkholderiales bacterium]|nr:TolC family protein [Burkholderiales bacterium]MDR4516360.1 TolC family protein [Nitrosomonas sp.]
MKTNLTIIVAFTAIILPIPVYGETYDRNVISQTQMASESKPNVFTVDNSDNVSILSILITEALENNPEIIAAQREQDAARQRIAPAGALDDPMLEAGVINLPLASSPFNRDDMTMKMIGLSQRLPFPGKRGLRRDVATRDAQSIEYGYEETVNRVIRSLKIAYYDLGLTHATIRLVEKNKSILEDFLHIAEDHYTLGMGSQADVLKAQTQISRMQDELLRLGRELSSIESELVRALGRSDLTGIPKIGSPQLHETLLNQESLFETAFEQRPQLKALQSIIARTEKEVDLARRNYYPDLDVRLSYGQRNAMPDGIGRPDMVSFSVAINLPVWRDSKLAPRIAESLALRDQAINLYQAQRNEITAGLRQQLATADQNMKSIRLYQTAILPQALLTVESALAAYQVNRVDFLTLLDSQMVVFEYEINLITAVANYNKALAEIDFITGSLPNKPTASGEHDENN